MTRKLGDQGLDTLERRFQELRDQIGAMAEAARPELEIALQEVSQAIAALRAAGGSSPAESPACPEAEDSPAPAHTILYNIFRAIPDLLTVIDRDFNIIMSNWHESAMVPEEARRDRPKCYQVYHHRDRPCDPCHVREVFATGRPQRTEKINLLDGRIREFIAFPILNESGQVILAAEHVRDITDGRLVEQALKESGATLRTLIEANPDSLFLLDTRGVILAASHVAAQRLGKSLSAIIGADLHGMLPPEVSKKRFEIMQRVVATGQPARFEDVRGDFCLDSSITPIFDQDKVVQLAVLGVDITDRKNAEQALQESEARFRAIFATAQDSIFIKDRSFRYTQVNPAMERLFGLPADDFIGLTEKDLFGEDAAVLVRKQDQRVLEGEVIKGVITLPVMRVPTTFHVIKVPLHDEAGEIGGICGIARDITDLNRAEDALKESEERFRMLFEYAPDAYILADMQGEIIDCNQATEELAGYGREELIGNNFACLPWLDFRQQVRLADLLAQAARGEVMGPVDFTLTRKDGGEVIAEGMNLPLYIQGQNLVLTIVRDITARKQAEVALRESEARFRHISSTISDICYSCSTGPDGSYAIDWLVGAVERITGYSVEEIKARRCWEFLVIEADQPLFQRNITGLAAGSSGACELRLRHKNGGIIWVASFAKIVLESEQPELLSLYGGLVDITARKGAEAALAAHLQFLQLLLDTIPNPIFFKDAQGVYLGCNRAFEDFLGVTRQEIVGKSVYDFSPPELADKYHRMDLEAFQVAGTQVYESRVKAADGALHHVVFHKATFLDPTGGLGGLVGIIMDITGLKQAEAELRESEELFRSLVENITHGITLISSDYRITMTNSAQGNMFHKYPREFVGKECFREFEKRQGVCPHCPGTIAMATGQKADIETKGVRDDGSFFVARIHAFPSFGSDGEITGFIEVVEDITQSKQVEEALRESEQRFRLMAETIQDVFWITTPDIGKMVYVSPAYEQVWGRSSQELFQSPQAFLEAIHPEDRDRALATIVADREQGSSSDHAYRIIKPDGAVRWIHDRGYPVRDDQGRVILYTGVATDITERKALEGQLLQAQKMEAVGRLAGGVAHDFNNLLMAIMGYGELMRAKVLKDDPLYSHLENILKAGDRAAALTRQLLTFSRQKIVNPQVIDLNRVVLDLEPMLRRLIGEDLDLEVVTDRRLGVVKADPGQMGQIIMNLAVNARDAMPQGGRLTLKTAAVDFMVGCHTRFGLAPPGPYVRLEVQDTGVGMDEATQAHVFEPFFTTKEPGKGTGLGLSTVYGIVKQSGGYLDLASAPGAGSTFTIYLPRLEAMIEPPKAKIPLTASFRGEETILLVEDEDMLRGLLAKFLRLYGYTVLEARHGGEALLTCERHPGPIHLMVTDVVMPRMSGRELADRLTPLRPEMKVLYMSGYTEDALIQHGVADLSVAFLQKPFKPIELARRVHAVLHFPVTQ